VNRSELPWAPWPKIIAALCDTGLPSMPDQADISARQFDRHPPDRSMVCLSITEDVLFAIVHVGAPTAKARGGTCVSASEEPADGAATDAEEEPRNRYGNKYLYGCHTPPSALWSP
jgi:hypothetical protein